MPDENHCPVNTQSILGRKSSIHGCERSYIDLVPTYAESRLGSPTEVKRDFGNASVLKDGRVVFNIAGNKYRLAVWINYDYAVVHVRLIGTYKHYDEIDAQTI